MIFYIRPSKSQPNYVCTVVLPLLRGCRKLPADTDYRGPESPLWPQCNILIRRLPQSVPSAPQILVAILKKAPDED